MAIPVMLKDKNGQQIQALKLGGTAKCKSVAFTGTAGTSAAIDANNTSIVRVVATQDCFIEIGAAVTATTSDAFLPAGLPEYFIVGAGEVISAIQEDTAGTLYITEMEGLAQ